MVLKKTHLLKIPKFMKSSHKKKKLGGGGGLKKVRFWKNTLYKNGPGVFFQLIYEDERRGPDHDRKIGKEFN